MKKKTVLIAVLIITVLLLGALFIKQRYELKRQEALAAGQNAVIVSHDKTVFPPFIYNIDSISDESIIGEKHYSFDFSEQDSLEKVVELSSHIVHGRINNLSYTFINGRAWTVAELLVLDSYKGSLEKNDVISLYYPGGYVSVKDYNSQYAPTKSGSDSEFYSSFVDDAPLPYLLEEGIFCISSEVEKFSIPEGSFILSCGNSSLLTYLEDGSLQWKGSTIGSESLFSLIN